MIISFPKVPPRVVDQTYMMRVLDLIKNGFQQVNSRRFAQDRVLLAGEDGNTYRLYVDNTGTLQISAVSGNDFD